MWTSTYCRHTSSPDDQTLDPTGQGTRICPHQNLEGRRRDELLEAASPGKPAVRIQTGNPTDGLREGVVEAGVPVDDDDDVHDQVGDAKRIGVVGSGLGPLEELHHPETKMIGAS